MSKQILFSVILPTYNRAKRLPKAIESVIGQTFTDWELIIVDDGSTDGTRDLVAGYVAKDPRIKYIYQNHAERSAARNKGIEQAIGQYVCFLDSDDYFLPNRLQLLSDFITADISNSSFLFTGGVILESESGSRQEVKINFFKEKQLDFLATTPINHPQVCIRADVIKQFRYDERFSIGEDMELWFRIADRYSLTYISAEPSIIVVDHNNRSVNVKRFNSALAHSKMLRYIFTPPHPGSKVSKATQRIVWSNCYFNMAKYHAFNNQRWSAARFIFVSILCHFSSEQLKYRGNILYHLLSFRSMKSVQALIG